MLDLRLWLQICPRIEYKIASWWKLFSCVELTLLVVRARHTQSLRRPSSFRQRAMFYLMCKMRSVCLSSSITIGVVFIVSAFRWHQCLCFVVIFNHRQRL